MTTDGSNVAETICTAYLLKRLCRLSPESSPGVTASEGLVMYNLLPLASSSPLPSSEFDFLLSSAESFHSYPKGRELSRSFACLPNPLLPRLPIYWGCFVTSGITSFPFPVSAMATANQRQFYCSRFPGGGSCISANHISGCMQDPGKSAFSKYGCTPQMTGLAPFGPPFGISLARHKVTILFVPCCTNPFILLFGTSLLPSWQSQVA
jgi:hypothetical protein